MKPPLFQHVPQQGGITDGIYYISPNSQPKWEHICLLQKNKPVCFCPKSCNLNSQTGQGQESRQKLALALSSTASPYFSGASVVSGESEVMVLGEPGAEGQLAK